MPSHFSGVTPARLIVSLMQCAVVICGRPVGRFACMDPACEKASSFELDFLAFLQHAQPTAGIGHRVLLLHGKLLGLFKLLVGFFKMPSTAFCKMCASVSQARRWVRLSRSGAHRVSFLVPVMPFRTCCAPAACTWWSLREGRAKVLDDPFLDSLGKTIPA